MTNENNLPDSDGFNVGSGEGIIQAFLDPGLAIEEQLARAGLPMDEAMDYAEIWRTGVAFRVSNMIYYSVHALISGMGADRQARDDAITALIGHRIQSKNKMIAEKRGALGLRGKSSDSPQEMDAKPAS